MSDYHEENSTEEVPEEVEKYAQEAVNHFQQELSNEQPSAPPADDNGFIVVPQDETTTTTTTTTDETKVVEESVKPVVVTKKTDTKSEQSCSGFKACPYYFLGNLIFLL